MEDFDFFPPSLLKSVDDEARLDIRKLRLDDNGKESPELRRDTNTTSRSKMT